MTEQEFKSVVIEVMPQLASTSFCFPNDCGKYELARSKFTIAVHDLNDFKLASKLSGMDEFHLSVITGLRGTR